MESEQSESPLAILKSNPPPEALPDGWVIHESRSNPGCVYYYNQYTEEKRWDLPIVSNLEGLEETIRSITKVTQQDSAGNTTADDKNDVRGILKPSDPSSTPTPLASTTNPAESDSKKRALDREREERKKRHASEKKSRGVEKVRVLHILKKHNASRRPASWRQAKITISKEEAIAELEEIISILDESKGDAKELRATFEELAKTESDCTSAKRGGDVGFFGRKKMQPSFEKASFGLEIGEMSGIIETGSGVHVILRLG